MKVFYAVLTLLLLVACAPKTQVTTPVTALAKGEHHMVNADLHLIAFPRSVIYISEGKGQKTTLEFTTPIQIETVYNFFDTQLTSDGWQRQSRTYTQRLNTYQGAYTRYGERLTVTLKLNNSRYLFETR